MAYLILNLVLFIASIVLTYSGFSNYDVFLTVPISLKILILIGLVTPILNLYDVIKIFVFITTSLSQKDTIGDSNED